MRSHLLAQRGRQMDFSRQVTRLAWLGTTRVSRAPAMSDAPRRLLGSRGASQGGGNDVGSRTLPAELGFQGACHHEFGLCLVTGYPDNGISRDTALAHLSDIVAATDVPILPISRAASPRTPQVSRKAFILPWRPAWPGCRSRIRRAIQRGRSMHSARPSRGCVRHAGPSTRQAVTRCSSGVRVLSGGSARSR